MSKLRIAVDQCVGLQLVKEIEQLGHQVVVRAKPAEPDQYWLARARKAGAEVYVTRDNACKIFCWALGKRLVAPPADMKVGRFRKTVIQLIQEIAHERDPWLEAAKEDAQEAMSKEMDCE